MADRGGWFGGKYTLLFDKTKLNSIKIADVSFGSIVILLDLDISADYPPVAKVVFGDQIGWLNLNECKLARVTLRSIRRLENH